MPPIDRAANRDVHIYDAQKPTEKELGGLILTIGVTNKDFYEMIDIIIIIHGTYVLRYNSSDTGASEVPKDDTPLQPGNYFIASAAQIQVNDEPPLLRTISNSTGTRNHTFRDAVRSRDQQCVITGREPTNPTRGIWRPLEAAHIFPLAYQQHWNDSNLGRWIRERSAEGGGGSINSVQNGLLLEAGVHSLFDDYIISINPNNHYKIIFFERDVYHIAGNYLRSEFINHPERPGDALLQWHFRQAVLTNMKGAGAPVFEHDFPSGSDMMGDIISGPMAAERMEFELFSRLAAVQDL